MKVLVPKSLPQVTGLAAVLFTLLPLAAQAQDYATIEGTYEGTANFTMTASVLGVHHTERATSRISELELSQTGDTFSCTVSGLGQDWVCTGSIQTNKLVSVSAPAQLFWDSNLGSLKSGRLSGSGEVRQGQIVLNLHGPVTGEVFGISDDFDMTAHIVLEGPAKPCPTFALMFPSAAGTYAGLFYAAAGITSTNSGSIVITLTRNGAFSSKLQLAGSAYSFRGQFSTEGTSSNAIVRKDAPPLTVLLQVGSPEGDSIGGTVSSASWQATVTADRLSYNARTNPAPQAGRYTMVLEGAHNEATLPGGEGYGTVTVSAAGKLCLAAALADGTRVTQSAIVSKNELWPLCVSTGRGQSLLLGWVGFTNAETFGGSVAWTKPSAATKCYPEGFCWLTQATGARYEAPGKGTNVLGATNSFITLTLAGGHLSQELTSEFSLNGLNQVRNLVTTNRARLTFSPSSGLFHGHGFDPVTKKSIPFNGVLLQQQAGGAGFFLDAKQSGRVSLGR